MVNSTWAIFTGDSPVWVSDNLKDLESICMMLNAELKGQYYIDIWKTKDPL